MAASMEISKGVGQPDVVVIGGGAAGLMCAAIAGARGRQVVVLEGSNRCGKKILMSGGGRCNFTNLYCAPDNFLSHNSHFCKSALARYTPADFIALVDAYDIAWHEKERGQLFCDGSSKQIVRMLLDECAAAGVHIITRAAITSVTREAEGIFTVHHAAGVLHAGSLVVASGGLSIPKMGASGFGFELARQFDIPVRDTRAALVPFTLSGASQSAFTALAGVAVEVEAACIDTVFDGGMLFTHKGLSGPPMLQLSSYWSPGTDIVVDFLPGTDAGDWLYQRQHERPDARVASVLAERLPRRLAGCICAQPQIRFAADKRLRQLAPAALEMLAQQLSQWRFTPAGTEGYRTAEVTLGGVDTHALSSATMATRDVPGLYFIGEVVDVTGHLGGHNFQWAWASAQAAGAVV